MIPEARLQEIERKAQPQFAREFQPVLELVAEVRRLTFERNCYREHLQFIADGDGTFAPDDAKAILEGVGRVALTEESEEE